MAGTLVLVRHGQSEWNEHYKWYDPWRQDAPRFADSPLTGSGINDAIELARAVATKADFYEDSQRLKSAFTACETSSDLWRTTRLH